jgi:hypothetical protein
MTDAQDQIVFDPRGTVAGDRLTLAPRVATLGGLRVGVLDNTKWNAGRLLRDTAAWLDKQYSFAAVTHYRKESFSKVADPALVARIAAETDIVLTAIGD